MKQQVRLLVRGLLTWMVESVALVAMAPLIPGLAVEDWSAGLVAVLAIGLLNALVRPAILLGAANLGIVPFVAIALVVNVVTVLAAGWLVAGFDLNDSIWTALIVSFALATLNAAVSGVLSVNDDDSFYRHVVRRWSRRSKIPGGAETPGLVIVQIDGLPEAILRQALRKGKMPTLARWLRGGSHRLVGWEADLPCMTTSAQAAILHGDNREIPAFFWFDKQERRVMSSASPYDLGTVQRRLANGKGLLSDDGVSVTNLFSGDAERPIMTVGTLIGEDGGYGVTPDDFIAYLLNPYNLYRGIAGMIGEAILEVWQALLQLARNVHPRGHRLGFFVIQRGAANVVLRDATTWAVVGAMYAGRRVIYCDYLGYDEVAHFAGPETRDALDTLIGIDRQLRQLELAAGQAPRPYQFVVLSDHGQSTAYLFEQEYGQTLGELVGDLLKSDTAIQIGSRSGEATRHLRSLLHDVSQSPGRAARRARRVLRLSDKMLVAESRGERANHALGQQADVVVTSSGNLAHIYFARQPNRVTLEQIAAADPVLIPGLVDHPGLEFVVVYSERRGPVALGRHGLHELDTGRVEGDADPLADLTERTPAFLQRLAGFAASGDIIVCGRVERESGRVVGFDSLVGAHGGPGGMQTAPFLIYPSDWTPEPPTLVGALDVHAFLVPFTRESHARDSDTTSESAEVGAAPAAAPLAETNQRQSTPAA